MAFTNHAAGARRRSVRRHPQAGLATERLESRQMMAADVEAPVVRAIGLPAAKTYGTDQALTFTLNFNERVRVAAPSSQTTFPVEVGFMMRDAAYVRGSGTKSLVFRVRSEPNDVDTDGVSIGRVTSENDSGVRGFDFRGRIEDLAGNPASAVIPRTNTSRILVDAAGPVVADYGDFQTAGRRVSLQVSFDTPVTVRGTPLVPVTIDGVDRELSFVRAVSSNRIEFAWTAPRGTAVSSVSFRQQVGEVIYVPGDTWITDRFGNEADYVKGEWQTVLREDGLSTRRNRVIVLGAHYEFLGTKTQTYLNEILTTEANAFNPPSTEPYWSGFTNPVYPTPTHDVDLYRIAYRSSIPEQGDRPTVAYGLVAVPRGVTGPLPVVSYQHGTLVEQISSPSLSFSYPANPADELFALYMSTYETRINVAQFAGHGYAVIAADYFGIGNSRELDGYMVKASAQQACLDMYTAAKRLLTSLSHEPSELFLTGWSQGGVVTVAFQERLEELGIPIAAVSTAAAQANTELGNNLIIFNPRTGDDGNAPDGIWLNIPVMLTAFSLEAYHQKPGTALDLLGRNYEASRTFYTRQYESYLPGETETILSLEDGSQLRIPRWNKDLIVARYGNDPAAFYRSSYATLLRTTVAGKVALASDMKVFYGAQDEACPVVLGAWLGDWQQNSFNKQNIDAVSVANASHRSAFFFAVQQQLEWFGT